MTITPQIIYEVYIGSIWEDISDDVIQEQETFYGITGNGKTDRVADVGSLTLVMRNDASNLGGMDGFYTPNLLHSKTGWKKGIPFRLRIVFDNNSHTKFYGHIDSIVVDSVAKQVKVTVYDWMDYATNYPLSVVSVSTDKDISEVVQTIVSGMPFQPLHTSYAVGQDTFIGIFDTVKDSTKAISEFQKLALSEFGYIYITRDKIDGETLVVESRNSRRAGKVVKKIPLDGGFLLLENGGYLLQENGDRFIIETGQDSVFHNNMVSLGLIYGDTLVNKITTKSYPRRIDTTAQILYSLNTPIQLSASEIKTNFVGSYKDPLSKANQVTGKDMVTPVASTDYQMFSNSDGTGIDLTANLVVTANYFASEVNYTLENVGGVTGYVTKLQARGYGIYLYEPLSYVAEDSTSITNYGYSELNLDQKYQTSPISSKTITDVILRQQKEPKSNIQNVSFIANYDSFLMNAFLYCDVGDLVYLKDSVNEIDGYYFIQGIKFKVRQGGIIPFTWNVVDSLSLEENYWKLGTSKLGSETILGY